MTLVRFYLLIGLSLCSIFVNAADGCLVGNTLYTTRTTGSIQVNLLANGMNVFTQIPPISTDNCISGTIVGSCQVCHGNPSVGLNLAGIKILVCTSGLNLFAQVDNGIYYSSYILECELDNYSLPFGAIIVVFGVIFIKKGNKNT